MRHPTVHIPEAVYHRNVWVSRVSRYQQNLRVISITMEQHVSLGKKMTPGRSIKMKWNLKWIHARRQEANRLRAVSLRPAEDLGRSREQEDVDLWCNCCAVRNREPKC